MMRYPFRNSLPLRILLGVLALLSYAAPGSAIYGVRRRTAVVAGSAGAATGAAAASSAAASQQQAAAAQQQQAAAAQQQTAAANQAAAQSAAAAQQAATAANQAAAAAAKPAAPAPKTTQQKLQELQGLYKQGLITESDYNAAKAKILAEALTEGELFSSTARPPASWARAGGHGAGRAASPLTRRPARRCALRCAALGIEPSAVSHTACRSGDLILAGLPQAKPPQEEPDAPMRCRDLPTLCLAPHGAPRRLGFSAAQTPNPDREAYFGETHVHTGLVVRRLHLRQHEDDAGRRLQVRDRRADQARRRLRHQDRDPPRLDGRDRSLRVRRRRSDGEHAGHRDLEAADREAAHREGSRGHPARLPLPRHEHDREQAHQGARLPRDRRQRLEAEQRHRQSVQQARQVHGLLRVRVDVDAQQHEHAPQRLLQGVPRGSPDALLLARLAEPRRPLELDGRTAQGRPRAARDLAQREPLGRPHVSHRRRQQGPAHRRRLGGLARPQRTPDRDQADQGPVGDAPDPVADRRVRQLRDLRVPAGRPRSAARRRFRAASPARP